MEPGDHVLHLSNPTGPLQLFDSRHTQGEGRAALPHRHLRPPSLAPPPPNSPLQQLLCSIHAEPPHVSEEYEELPPIPDDNLLIVHELQAPSVLSSWSSAAPELQLQSMGPPPVNRTFVTYSSRRHHLVAKQIQNSLGTNMEHTENSRKHNPPATQGPPRTEGTPWPRVEATQREQDQQDQSAPTSICIHAQYPQNISSTD